ncbi:MAG: hypothetical protein R3F54_18150 [Alphaproteobacteria bacterium]
MALLIDGQYRVGNLPKAPKPAPKPASTPVDASDRKFYIQAAEKNGDKKVLNDFDAALAAQRKPAPPKPAASPSPQNPAVAQKPHVQAERAADPSDQKFYNMAVDRQNKIIDLENRAASLQHSIDALGTAGGYATQAMQAELDDVDAELAALQGGSASEPPLSRGEEIARRYAPVLVLPDGDYDLPGAPQDFIDNSSWREDRSFWPDRGIYDNNNDADADDFTAAQIGQDGQGNQFLDLDNDVRGRLGREDAPFFYQVDDPDQPSKVTYWFFYPYNDGPGPQNHEGDFERITLELDPATGKPTQAIYSAHGNTHTEPVAFDDLQFHRDPKTGEITEKPLVYVASGSHASYTEPGVHQSDAPGWLRRVAGDRVDDHTAGGLDDAAYVIDTGANLADVQQQDWYPQEGPGVHWGEIGEAEWSTGPHGPSEEKDHVELD